MADHYIGVVIKDPNSEFGVVFPDFPGCVSVGKTFEDALKLGSEALALHVRGLREDGMPLPQPRTPDQVLDDPEYAGGVPVGVPFALES